jgi:hypothetical protein
MIVTTASFRCAAFDIHLNRFLLPMKQAMILDIAAMCIHTIYIIVVCQYIKVIIKVYHTASPSFRLIRLRLLVVHTNHHLTADADMIVSITYYLLLSCWTITRSMVSSHHQHDNTTTTSLNETQWSEAVVVGELMMIVH